MPVVPCDGTPLFGGKTIVMSGAKFKGRLKPATSSAAKRGDESFVHCPLPSPSRKVSPE